MIRRTMLAAALAAVVASGAVAEPARFYTPDAAVGAVVAALEAHDRAAAIAVFGPESEDVILTGDDAQDRETWTDFLDGWREMNRIAVETGGEAATLFIGREQWPFPIRLQRGADGLWAFDADGAREEIRLRRIGRNELDVLELMRAYVRVQADYRRSDWDGDGVMAFAASILSAPGARDGLYWPPEPGAPQSPVGDFMARAAADGYSVGGADESPDPYFGYYYRVLHCQSDAAPGGAMEYRENDRMIAGHALLAFPADYGESGVMSFMVGENGVIFEADLGEDTLDAAAAITLFDPAAPWVPAD